MWRKYGFTILAVAVSVSGRTIPNEDRAAEHKHAQFSVEHLIPDKERKKGRQLGTIEKGERKKAEPVQEQLHKDVDRTLRKARGMNPQKMLYDDIMLARSYLMPGKVVDMSKKGLEVSFIGVAVLWFFVYRAFIYKDDRREDFDHWTGNAEAESQAADTPRPIDDPKLTSVHPDIVLVFHKPDFAYSDKDTDMPIATLQSVIDFKHGSKCHLPRMERLCESHRKSTMEKLTQALDAGKKNVRNTLATAKALTFRQDRTDKEKGDEEEGNQTIVDRRLATVRSSLLQDLYENLPSCGFHVSVFSSIDNDEIFLCITLKDTATMEHHLRRNAVKLQLSKAIPEKLQVAQPREEPESSPPYVRYDSRMCKNILGEGAKDVDFYKAFGQHGGSIIPGTERVRILISHLNQGVNLDAAVEKGLLLQWFPVHAPERVKLLQKSWARWNLLTDMTCVQPISLINEYCSSRVAFVFAWNGVYAKWLLALVPMAILYKLADQAAFHSGKNEYWNRGSVLGFSLVVLVWARFAFNTWKCEEEYFIASWDVESSLKDGAMRPDFVGTLEQSQIDLNEEVVTYSRWHYNLRQCLAWSITLSFCLFVFLFITLWLELFHGRVTPVASIVQAVMIQVFTQIFNWMAEALTNAENHKYQREYYGSYLMKLFIFQLVNQYAAFFYIAVKQQFTEQGCSRNEMGVPDCLGSLRKQLPMTLCVLVMMRIVQVVMATVMVWLKLWYEDYQLRKSGETPQERTDVETQGKFGPYRTREQIEAMTSLCLTLGYVLIFGGVAPLVVPLCFLVFLVQIRASAVLITTAVHRPVPRRTVGLGPWLTITNVLMNVGVAFTGYLLVSFGPLFAGTMLLTKVTGLLLYMICVQFLWWLVDLICSPQSEKADLLKGRRAHVLSRLVQVNEDVLFGRASNEVSKGQSESSKIVAPFAREIASAAWSDIPLASAVGDLRGVENHEDLSPAMSEKHREVENHEDLSPAMSEKHREKSCFSFVKAPCPLRGDH